MSHQFKKQYGQNFLRSSRFIAKLIEGIDPQAEDTVVEIGPGEGNIANHLLEKAKKVIAVEVDYDLIVALVKRFGDNPKLEILHQSILDVNLGEHVQDLSYKAIGSLPYNISKKIIAQVMTQSPRASQAAFIIQEEVAKEYAAQAPQATFLSNMLRLYADVGKSISIPASQFFPKPKVNGGILLLKSHQNFSEEQRQAVIQLLKIGFSSPRKTLANNLKGGNLADKAVIDTAIAQLNLSPTVRPAELDLSQWVRLSDIISS